MAIYDHYLSDENILNLFCEFMLSYAHKVKGIAIDEPNLTVFTLE